MGSQWKMAVVDESRAMEERAMVFQTDVFEGKVVLITGGGTGIGRALALDFARHGARVIVAARRAERLAETVELIEAAGGLASYKTLDIRDADQIAQVVEEVWQECGRIDVLVNNAGGNFVGPAVAMSPNGWRTVIDINLTGTFLMSREVGSRMMEDGRGGRVINISATNAANGSPLMAHSGASKAGINSLTETLAVEWGRANITVNAVLPGPVRTEGSDERLWTDPKTVQRLESRIPLGRFGTPQDISPLVLFLASEGGSFITGALITVDGGDRLRTPF
jgi:NAD(P)-dependent dehydrogenase (short-subunit alcohol dehydrogenase family)